MKFTKVFLIVISFAYAVNCAKLNPKKLLSKVQEDAKDNEEEARNRVECGQPAFLPFEHHPLASKGIVRPNSWPWHASIRYRSRHRCSGVLISKRHVLTSASCFSRLSMDAIDYEVWLGKHDRDDIEVGRDQQLPVEAIHLHPDYAVKTVYDADLALVRLDGAGAWLNTNYTAPICLRPPQMMRNGMPGAECYVTGFGSMNRQNFAPALGQDKYLKQAEVGLIHHDRCGKFNRMIKAFLGNHSQCAIVNEPQLCQVGDTGSPLVCKHHLSSTLVAWWLGGIASSGMECSSKSSTPVVFTRTASFVGWIMKIAGDVENIVTPY